MLGNKDNLTKEQLECLEKLYNTNKLSFKYLVYTLYIDYDNIGVDFSEVYDCDVYDWYYNKLLDENQFLDIIDNMVVPILRKNKKLYKLNDFKNKKNFGDAKGTAKTLYEADIINTTYCGSNNHENDLLSILLNGLIICGKYERSNLWDESLLFKNNEIAYNLSETLK